MSVKNERIWSQIEGNHALSAYDQSCVAKLVVEDGV